MKKILFLALSAICYQVSTAQIKKSNWLLGGNVNFSSSKTDGGPGIVEIRETNFNFQPNIGYFFSDKLAGGLRLSYMNDRVKSNSSTINNTLKFQNFSGGPFLRYYFLPTANKINFLLDGSYLFGTSKGDFTGNSGTFPGDVGSADQQTGRYSFSAGPVIFLKPTVGLEFLVSYSGMRNFDTKSNSNTLQFGFGFQIHL